MDDFWQQLDEILEIAEVKVNFLFNCILPRRAGMRNASIGMPMSAVKCHLYNIIIRDLQLTNVLNPRRIVRGRGR